jgi:hypothetical protein
VVTARQLLKAGSDRFSLCAGAKHLFDELLDLTRCERYKSGHRNVLAALFPHLCIVVISDAVGTSAGLLCDALKDLLERQTLLLRLICRFPQKAVFFLAPSRMSAHIYTLHIAFFETSDLLIC